MIKEVSLRLLKDQFISRIQKQCRDCPSKYEMIPEENSSVIEQRWDSKAREKSWADSVNTLEAVRSIQRRLHRAADATIKWRCFACQVENETKAHPDMKVLKVERLLFFADWDVMSFQCAHQRILWEDFPYKYCDLSVHTFYAHTLYVSLQRMNRNSKSVLSHNHVDLWRFQSRNKKVADHRPCCIKNSPHETSRGRKL